MSNKKLRDTNTQTGDNPIFEQDWAKITQTSNPLFPSTPGAGIWYPSSETWTLADIGDPVKARCYNRHCKNETEFLTELRLGEHLKLKTYICEGCLEDLANKVKSELGIEEEEK